MKFFKFLRVNYRISIIILLALYAEHSSACNWFKLNTKPPSGHNINHRLITSANQGAHKSAGTNAQITPYIKPQQEPSHQDAENNANTWKLFFEILSKMSKSNNPVQAQESSNNDAGIKDIVWKLILETLSKMTITDKPDAAAKENFWKLIHEGLDKMAKSFSHVTNNIHLKQVSGNEDSTIKDMAWKLLSETLGEMFKTNLRIAPHTAATV